MVLMDGLQLAAAGIAIGLAGAAWVGRLFPHPLYDVPPADPRVLVPAAALLAVAVVAGCLLPVRRAAAALRRRATDARSQQTPALEPVQGRVDRAGRERPAGPLEHLRPMAAPYASPPSRSSAKSSTCSSSPRFWRGI